MKYLIPIPQLQFDLLLLLFAILISKIPGLPFYFPVFEVEVPFAPVVVVVIVFRLMLPPALLAMVVFMGSLSVGIFLCLLLAQKCRSMSIAIVSTHSGYHAASSTVDPFWTRRRRCDPYYDR